MVQKYDVCLLRLITGFNLVRKLKEGWACLSDLAHFVGFPCGTDHVHSVLAHLSLLILLYRLTTSPHLHHIIYM